MAKKARVYDGSQWQDLASSVTDLSNYPNMTTTPISGFRNAIINGDFKVWQRGTSFNSVASATYTADRWVSNYDGTSGTYVISQQAFTAGNPIPNYEPQFFLRYAVTVAGSGSTRGLDQKIEDVRTFAGQTITISFWAKADSTRTLGVQVYQNFGSGGSAEVYTSGTSANLTTSWTRFTTTLTVPSITGKTIGTNHFLALRFLIPAGVTPTIDIWGVQLEKGSIATPFEQRPIGTELALCQRYYYLHASNASEQIGTCILNSASEGICIVKFPVTMRIAPTSATTSGTNFYATFFNNTQYTFNSLNIFGSGVNSAGFFWTQTSLTVGWGGRLQIPSSGGGMVAFVAEL